MTPEEYKRRLNLIFDEYDKWDALPGDTPTNHPFNNRQRALTALSTLLREVIGPDEEPGRTMGPGMPSFQRDQLRRQLRTILGIKENTDE